MRACDWDVPDSDASDAEDVAGAVAPRALASVPPAVATLMVQPASAQAGCDRAGVCGVLELDRHIAARLWESRQTPADTDFSQLVVPHTTTTVVSLAARAAARGVDRRSSCEQVLQTVSSLEFGAVPPQKCMAAMTGSRREKVDGKLQSLAAAMHFGTRFFLEATVTALTALVLAETVVLQAVFRFFV